MNRRTFLSKTSAGLSVALAAPGLWSFRTGRPEKKAVRFRPYREGKTLVPVHYVTPDDGYYVHTFYDECPWSPDQRYLLVSRLPYQGKKPQWGDTAEICLIDLEERSIRTIYRTRAWGFQLGANAQWDDTGSRYVYTNDIIDRLPVCVRIDIATGETVAFTGAKYDVAPDGKKVISPNLMYMNTHQYGYSVPDPPPGKPLVFTHGQADTEGLWETDLTTNKTRLLASISRFIQSSEDADFYGPRIGYLFHAKYNRQGTRIMQVFRSQQHNQGRESSLFTLDADGSSLVQCLSRSRWNQKSRLNGTSNHPNWHPDGEHIVLNCVPRWLGYEDMLFCMMKYDGSGFRVLNEHILGSGHPSVEPATRYLVTDAYLNQTYTVRDNEIPIRLIDLKEGKEHRLCSVATGVGKESGASAKGGEDGGSHYKLDPHPAWSRDFRKLCINGAPEGRRQVLILDLAAVI